MGETGFSWFLQALCWLSPSFHGQNTAIQRTLNSDTPQAPSDEPNAKHEGSGPDDAPSMYLSMSFIFHHCFSCCFLIPFFVSPSFLTLFWLPSFFCVLPWQHRNATAGHGERHCRGVKRVSPEKCYGITLDPGIQVEMPSILSRQGRLQPEGRQQHCKRSRNPLGCLTHGL